VLAALTGLAWLGTAAAAWAVGPPPVPPADAPTENHCTGFRPCVAVKTGPVVVLAGEGLGAGHTCPAEAPNFVGWDVQGDPEVIVALRKPLLGLNERQIGGRFSLRQELDRGPATVEIVLGCSSEKVVANHSFDAHASGRVLPERKL
jgi:hypothetical protein